MSSEKTRTIQVNYLARVEGEGALKIKIKGKKVTTVELNIFEPPRFFEAMLRGRKAIEAPDITSRICGICPIAYQMSAIRAMEDALGIRVGKELESLRRLIYCGEWIESHALHVYMLHAPDFLGYEGAVQMAKDHPEAVRRGLQLKKAGNAILSVVGGREIHPINVRVGGFYRAPTKSELRGLLPQLEAAREIARETVPWVAGFPFPDWEREYEFVCLRAESGLYPIEEGRFISSRGLSAEVSEYEDHFEEIHVAHSTALHSRIKGRGPYLVGPMARMELNFDRLSPAARALSEKHDFAPPFRNPFKSIIARAVELFYVCEEAIRIIEGYEQPKESGVAVPVKSGTGYGATEAPRGVLYHRYRLGDGAIIEDAKIVPPTSQNQKSIEDDLASFVESHLSMGKKELTWKCEQTIRNYDPCISCATHFLDIRWEETE